GQVDEAIAHYQKGLETKPDFLAAYCNVNLGIALAGRGQVDEAISHYRKALEIKPDFVQALNSMAWIRATYSDPNFRDGPQAVTLSRQALELSPNDAGVMDTLAAAYAEANRFAEAVQTARKALDLARQHHKKDLAESIQAKILLYDAGIPFHEPPSSPVKASIQP
ncbi:MAG: tetratricopeptide repeat protein, partial [Thermoguttaceae bacterium]